MEHFGAKVLHGGVADALARLKDVAEGSFFREHGANIRDVLRGPINLEARRLESIV